MLQFQVAGAAGGNLLEHLLVESMGAVRGGGIFAWANTYGSRLLLDDVTFREFLRNGNFRLFIGTDTITDERAIETLIELTAANQRLDVRAFLNPTNGMFHPKLAWFEHHGHLSLIVGSGNLTKGGLLSNWEAFNVLRLSGAEATEALTAIESFLSERGNDFLPVHDARVLERAKLNTGNERSLKPKAPKVDRIPETVKSTEEILVAEIPRSDNRWSQANFTRNLYEGFFGAQVGSQRRIVLQHVDEDSNIGEVESRPSVEVASHNYRFELAAAQGIPYPASGRPIGVFLRQTTGEFLYMLVLPGQPGHDKLLALLSSRWSGPANQLRRILCTADELRMSWPAAPVWTTPPASL